MNPFAKRTGRVKVFVEHETTYRDRVVRPNTNLTNLVAREDEDTLFTAKMIRVLHQAVMGTEVCFLDMKLFYQKNEQREDGQQQDDYREH